MNQEEQQIFISYTEKDRDKVECLESIINNTKGLKALIIANNREPLKPLTEKVAVGIKESSFIIPILTPNSRNEQWINQEIGFALALSKPIIPIVDKSIFDLLKGFVHKECDLPYSYDMSKEILEFVKTANILVKDIIKDEIKSNEIIQAPNLNILGAARIKAKREFEIKRINVLESRDFFNSINDHLANVLFAYIREQSKLISQESGIRFTFETSDSSPVGLIVKAEGFSFSIAWATRLFNSASDAILTVKYWDGYISFKTTDYHIDDAPDQLVETIYNTDVDENFKLIWIEQKKKVVSNPKEIVDKCFTWLLKVIESKI